MEKWSKFSPLINFINSKKEEKALLEKDKINQLNQVKEFDNQIKEAIQKIEVTKAQLKFIVIPKSSLKSFLDTYKKGWIFGIASVATSEELKDKRRIDCHAVFERFLIQNGIA